MDPIGEDKVIFQYISGNMMGFMISTQKDRRVSEFHEDICELRNPKNPRLDPDKWKGEFEPL